MLPLFAAALAAGPPGPASGQPRASGALATACLAALAWVVGPLLGDGVLAVFLPGL